MFSFRQAEAKQVGVTRYLLFRNDKPVNYAETIDLWQNHDPFRAQFNRVLQQSPYQAYLWETPSISLQTMNQPFEFALVDYPRFASRKTDSKTYQQYFDQSTENCGIVTFPNLSGNSLLIVPSPRTSDDVYGHLATFVRQGPVEQVAWLWRVVGQAMAELLNEKPTWLSTAGGGVAWLHVRLDRSPKYYAYANYRTSK